MNRDDVLLDDFKRMQRLSGLNKGLIEFSTSPYMPPQQYTVTLYCKGIRLQNGRIREIDMHQVLIELGPDYPIKKPHFMWRTPIYHPNILATEVCLPGYVPSVRLDTICLWLWDLVCYRLYKLDNVLNKTFDRQFPPVVMEWLMHQHKLFPLDTRALRQLEPASPLPQSDDVEIIEINDL